MNKFFIILSIGLIGVGAIGFIVLQKQKNIQQENVTAQSVAEQGQITSKLTRSQKIEQKYQTPQDLIGVIPVSFEKITTSEQVSVPKTSNDQVHEIVKTQDAGKAASSVGAQETYNPYGLGYNHAMSAVVPDGEPQIQMDQGLTNSGYNPYAQAEYHNGLPKQSPVKSASNDAATIYRAVPTADHNYSNYSGQDDAKSYPKAIEPIHPVQSVQQLKPQGKTALSQPVEPSIVQPKVDEVSSSWMDRIKKACKKTLAVVGATVASAAAVAGIHSIIHKSETTPPDVDVDLSSVKPHVILPEIKTEVVAKSSEDHDIAGNAHGKLQEVQDAYEHDAYKESSDHKPAQTQGLGDDLTSVSAEVPVADTVSSKIDTPQVDTKVVDVAQATTGMLRPTKVLLAPKNPMQENPMLETMVSDQAMVSVQKQPSLEVEPVEKAIEVTSVKAVEPVIQPLCTELTPVVGQASRSLSGKIYDYCGSVLRSPVKMLALATKTLSVGATVGLLAYAAHTSQQKAIDGKIEEAVLQVARNFKPISIQPELALSQSKALALPTTSSIIAQITSGQASAALQSLAGQLACLRLR